MTDHFLEFISEKEREECLKTCIDIWLHHEFDRELPAGLDKLLAFSVGEIDGYMANMYIIEGPEAVGKSATARLAGR